MYRWTHTTWKSQEICFLSLTFSKYNRPAESVPFTWKWFSLFYQLTSDRSSHPGLFLGKVILKICSKFTVEHPCQSVISIKLLCLSILRNFQEHLFHRTPPVTAFEYYNCMYELKHIRFVSLKRVWYFPFPILKVYFFILQKVWTLWL